MLRLRAVSVFVVLSSLMVAGCQPDGRPAGAKPTKPVTVKLTYKGAPVDGATISFLADPAAYGRTDAQGVAKMKTYVEGDGAIIGSHKVTIIKAEAAVDNSADVSTTEYAPPDPNAPAAEVKSLIPPKYASPATSGLTAEVKDSGTNEISFELTD